jgi:hypothetical protein
MSHGHASTVDQNILIIFEVKECVLLHSQEPPAMLAHGTPPPILNDGNVGVVVDVHLKHSHENITDPKLITFQK